MDISKIHIWVGTNFDGDYDSYFKLDYSIEDIDDPSYKVCGFCKDIGLKWYDEDWIGVLRNPQIEDVDVFLSDLSVSDETLSEIKRVCINKGLEKVNAMFFYIDSNVKVRNKTKLYNKLVYIGEYDTDLD